MTTREKYLAKPRTGIRKVAYDIATMLGLKGRMIHQKAVREYETSWQLTYHEAALLVAATAALTTILTLMSCSAADTPPAAQPVHEAIIVSTGGRMAVTRTTTEGSGNTWAEGDKIVLVVKNFKNNIGGTETTTEHTYQAAAGAGAALSPVDLANTNFWRSTGETKQITGAWSFGTSTAPTLTSNTITSYTLETTQTGNGELLYSPGQEKSYDADPATRAFSLTFYHQLAKVIFNVKSDGPDPVISSATMTIPGSGTFSTPDTGEHNATWSFGSDASITPNTETTAADCIATYSAVVIPGDYSGKTLLQLATSNGTYSYIPASTQTLSPGMCYTFTITIKNGLMFYESVTVETWTTGTTYPVEL